MKDQLHRLIHTLKKSEKRYLKLRMEGGDKEEARQYLRLFDLLTEMPRFDRDRVQAEMGWTKFTQNYTMAKRYLMDKILDGLVEYRRKHDRKIDFRSRIGQIEQLESKGFHEEAQRRLTQAKKMARRTQHLHPLVELLTLERKLLVGSRRRVARDEEFARIQEEMNAALEGLRSLEAVRGIHYDFFLRMDKIDSKQRDMQLLEALERLGADRSPWLLLRVLHYNVLNQFHYLQGDFVRSLEAAREIIRIFDDFPGMETEAATTYIAALHNLINRCLQAQDYEGMMGYYHRLRDYEPPRDPVVQLQYFTSYHGLGMLLILNSGETAANAAWLEETLERLETGRQRMTKRNHVDSIRMAALARFMQGNFREALRWINFLLNDPSISEVGAFAQLARVLRLVIQFELGNADWLHYEIRQLMRGKSRELLYEFSMLLAKGLREILDTPDKTEKGVLFGQLLDQVRQKQARHPEHAVFTFFQFEVWLNCKIRSEDFAEAIRRNWLELGGPEIRDL